MKAKRQTITLAMRKSPRDDTPVPAEVPAYVIGDFATHRSPKLVDGAWEPDPEGFWCVSHVPTGRAIYHHINRLAEGKAFCEKLVRAGLAEHLPREFGARPDSREASTVFFDARAQFMQEYQGC